MRTSARALQVAVALGTVLVLQTAPASAQEACEAYSEGCDTGAEVLDTAGVDATSQTPPSVTPTTLPFTGGEVVLAGLAGAGAVAAGAAMVVAGRRRAGAST